MRPTGTRDLRRRPGGVLIGVVACLLVAGELGAQEPPIPRRPPAAEASDSMPVPPDSIADPGEAADTLPPLDVVNRFPRTGAPGWSGAVWEWDREALLAEAALTLTELLERIPGITPIRSGFLGHPEGVSALGAPAGYFEILLDGYALDPAVASTFDLSRLELVQLQHVRVERRLGRVRVELETLAPDDRRPFSFVEAGTGDYQTHLFRGGLLVPRFLGGPFALGIERLDSEGIGRREPANSFTGWLKWGIVRGTNSLQLELRRNRTQRRVVSDSGPRNLEGVRQDWVLRARAEPVPRLMTEAFFGITSFEDDLSGTFSDGRMKQGGVRAAYEGERGWARSTVRARSGDGLPGLEAEVAGGLRLPGPVLLSGDVTWADWPETGPATSVGLRTEAGPILGVRPFVEWSTGTRGIPAPDDDGRVAPLLDRRALRFGGELDRDGLSLGVARVLLQADSVPDFGLPFDHTTQLFPGGDLGGWEAVGRVPLFWEPLSVEGWYSRWDHALPWIYLPADSWRAALVYHHLPLQSGNLEILARLEGKHRGEMIVPADGGGTSAIPGMTSLDFYLQIRVLDVRAFIRWDNITNRLYLHDLPGRIFPGQRIFYGVKWQFWN